MFWSGFSVSHEKTIFLHAGGVKLISGVCWKVCNPFTWTEILLLRPYWTLFTLLRITHYAMIILHSGHLGYFSWLYFLTLVHFSVWLNYSWLAHSCVLLRLIRWMVMELIPWLVFFWIMAIHRGRSWGFQPKSWGLCGFLLLLIHFLAVAVALMGLCPEYYLYQSY